MSLAASPASSGCWRDRGTREGDAPKGFPFNARSRLHPRPSNGPRFAECAPSMHAQLRWVAPAVHLILCTALFAPACSSRSPDAVGATQAALDEAEVRLSTDRALYIGGNGI